MSPALANDFKCYYCTESFHLLAEVVTHSKLEHQNQQLKFGQLALDEKSGCLGYRTKFYPDIIPRILQLKNKDITVENGTVVIKERISQNISALRTPIKIKTFQSAFESALNNEINDSDTLSANTLDYPKFQCCYCNESIESLECIVYNIARCSVRRLRHVTIVRKWLLACETYS